MTYPSVAICLGILPGWTDLMATDGRPRDTKDRRALVIAGNDPAAKATVTRMLDEFGFDTVDAVRGPVVSSSACSADIQTVGNHCGVTQE
jgi:predicted dinucleotide-binding enzyme